MTTTTATAIPTGLDGDNFGTFESGSQQLQTLNDRDIYEVVLPVGAPAGSVIALTEVINAFTASGVALDIDASNRFFTPSAFATSSGDPVTTVAPVDNAGSVFLGVSTASSPNYNPAATIVDPGANIVFNYNTSVALVQTVLDTNGDGVIEGAELEALILGTNGVDNLIGSTNDDVILGFGGNDTIQGGNGNDEIDGGSGDDRISGQLGDDTLRGGAGNDAIFGGLGNDTIDGNDGNDTLRGGLGDDTINGGDGDDLISGEGGADVLNGGDGND